MPTAIHSLRPAPSTGSWSCFGCESREHGVCGALSDNELASLSRASTRRLVEGGRIIGGTGRADGLANILSGVVSLSKRLSDGRQQIVSLQFAPSLVGRRFVGRDDTQMAAAGAVRLCTFPRAEFEKAVAGNPAAEHRILLQTLGQLDETRDWLLAVARKSALERVSSYILMIASNLRSPPSHRPGRSIPLPLSRGEMGDFLGLTIETVSRKMTELRKAGIIAFEDPSSLRILLFAQLQASSGT